MPEDLQELVAAELAEPVDPRVAAMAAAIAARYGAASRAVLFYGSCLRQRELDGLMLDFYLIVSDYRQAYGRGWFALANRLIPPNVYPFEHQGLAAKYAVLSEADFAREMGPRARSTSVWARFAQPSRLAWAADERARRQVVATIADAAPTLFESTLPMLPPDDEGDDGDDAGSDIGTIWRRGFELTYAAELRAERSQRPGAIIDADPRRYERFGLAALARIAREKGVGAGGEVALARSPAAMNRWWRRMRRKGKALTLLRLAKASTTFAGGIDYLAWKINRHAGTDIQVKPWQRRWPLVGALILLPRLLKRGAIR
ncbi:hypothetical protein [Sphingosinicella terrae]|uniref:hypothetical protein n=1 Tax=Sphingosinicella terrae TaxID=2172047 RepID=UPI000E0DF183|nr:hypothetical protein [Sphingosinicella terrae]